MKPIVDILEHVLRKHTEFRGVDRFEDVQRYFGPGGLDEAEAICATANRDLHGFVLPPERLDAGNAERADPKGGPRGLLVESIAFDSPLPSGRDDNDRVPLRILRRAGAEPGGPLILFHHPMYQDRWASWEWFLAPLAARVPVAMMAAPNHFERSRDARWSGEWTLNANPARMMLAIRQWAWDHRAAVGLLEDAGYDLRAVVGYSLGAFQSLLLASAGGLDRPIVSIASTNRFAWGLVHGTLGRRVVAAMARAGIDRERLASMTSSLELDRHVPRIADRDVLFIRGLYDPVDPEPSQTRLENALRPRRVLRIRAGHGTLFALRGPILRETIGFLQDTGAIRRSASREAPAA